MLTKMLNVVDKITTAFGLRWHVLGMRVRFTIEKVFVIFTYRRGKDGGNLPLLLLAACCLLCVFLQEPRALHFPRKLRLSINNRDPKS